MPLEKQYEQHGFFVIHDFFSTKEILRLQELVDDIHGQWLDAHHDEFVEKKLINMHALTHPDYFRGEKGSRKRIKFFKYISPVKLTELLDELFEVEILFHNTQLFFNPHREDQQPYWHRDLQFSAISDQLQERELSNMLNLHVRIPLIKETGVELIPGTHRRWDTPLEHEVRHELNGHSNSEPLPDAVLVDLAPGDLMVFNAQLIHRGNYTLNTTRKALDLCVGKPHPLVTDGLDPAILPTLEELTRIKNCIWYKRSLQLVEAASV